MKKQSLFFNKNQIDAISDRLTQLLSGLTQNEKQLVLCPEFGDSIKLSRKCGDNSCSVTCGGKCSGGTFDSFGKLGCGDNTCSQDCSGACAGGTYDSFGKHGCGDSSCANTCYGNASK